MQKAIQHVEMKIISYKKYPVYCYLEYNWCYNIASSLIYLVSYEEFLDDDS